MSGIKPRLVRSLEESDTHWVEELDSVLWGLRTTPNRTTGYTPFFMVYGAEAVLPCYIIHDSPRVRMYEEREAELDRQDSLDALEEERNVAKARSAFYQQQARRYQSREVRAKTYNVGELVLRLPEKKKDKLKPKWEGPFIIEKFSVEVRTICVMHQTIDSSRTHGTRPDSEDSTPSAELHVCLLTFVSLFKLYPLSLYFLHL